MYQARREILQKVGCKNVEIVIQSWFALLILKLYSKKINKQLGSHFLRKMLMCSLPTTWIHEGSLTWSSSIFWSAATLVLPSTRRSRTWYHLPMTGPCKFGGQPSEMIFKQLLLSCWASVCYSCFPYVSEESTLLAQGIGLVIALISRQLDLMCPTELWDEFPSLSVLIIFTYHKAKSNAHHF